MSYWYPQSYPQMQGQFPTAVQAAHAGVGTYPYGQYYSTAGATTAANFNAAAASAAALGMQMVWPTPGAAAAASVLGNQTHHIAPTHHHRNPLGAQVQIPTPGPDHLLHHPTAAHHYPPHHLSTSGSNHHPLHHHHNNTAAIATATAAAVHNTITNNRSANVFGYNR